MAKSKKVKGVLEPLGFGREMIVKLMVDAFGLKSAKKETNDSLTEKIATLGDQLDDDDLSELEEKDADSHGVATAILEALEKGQPVVVIDDEEDEEEDETTDVESEDTEEDEEDGEDTEDEEDEEVETEDDESDEESDDSDDDEDTEDEEEEEVEAKPAKKGKTPEKVQKKPAAKPTGKKTPPASVAKKGAKPTKLPPDKPKKAKSEGPKTSKTKGKIYYIIKLLSQATSKKPITKTRILAELVKKFGKEQEDAMRTTINSQINGQLKAPPKSMVLGNNGKKGDERGYWIEDMGEYVFPE